MAVTILIRWIFLSLVLLVTLAACIKVCTLSSVTPVEAQEKLQHSLVVHNISKDGIAPTLTPSPTPTPTLDTIPDTVTVGGDVVGDDGFSCPLPGGDWGHLIDDYPWDWQEACSVMDCESDGYASAYSSSGCVGLMQICPRGSSDPATNLAQAYAKWQYGVGYGNRWGEWNRWGSCGHF